MFLSDLYKNTLVHLILEESVEDIKRLDKEGKFKNFLKITKEEQDKNWKSMSDQQKFRMTTFRLLTEVLKKAELLNYCEAFINSYPKRRLWQKNFSRADYVIYHLENYYRNITGILDRFLLFVNHLYRIGLPQNEVKFRLIINNENLKNEKVVAILKAFDKGIQGIKGLRNMIEHRGRYSDSVIDEIGSYELILNKSESLTQKQKNVLKVYLKIKYSSYIRKKKKELVSNNDQIFIACDKFFDSLVSIYKNPLKL